MFCLLVFGLVRCFAVFVVACCFLLLCLWFVTVLLVVARLLEVFLVFCLNV